MTTWALGDYPLMAERLMPIAREAVELAEVAAGDRVLDVACGTGNGALLAAERGASAVGVDFEPALLEIARGRAREAGSGEAGAGAAEPPTRGATAIRVPFVQGDAAALPFPDGSFDVTLSLFGSMYAPDHPRAAAELVRVTKPGGRIVVTAWTPGSFMPRMGQTLGPYLPPPPPGSGPPSRWGDPAQLTELLGLPLSVADRRKLEIDEHADFFVATAGHVLAERQRLEQERRWKSLEDDMRALVGAGPVELEYLLARADRPPP